MFPSSAKTGLVRVVVFLLAIGPGGLAGATPIASYEFGTSGELDGMGGGTGWAGNWSAATGVTQLTTAPATFFYDVPGGGTVAPTGALAVTGNNGAAVLRSLDTAQTGDVYISYLTRWSAGNLDGNDFAVWYFQGQNNPNIGWKTNEGPSNEDFMARLQNGQEAYPASAEFDVGDTVFVVGRLSKAGGGDYDRVSLWLNPSADDAFTPDAVASGGVSGISSFDMIGMRTANIDGSDSILFGSLRLGTAWEDVVPGGGGGVPLQVIFEDPFDLDPASNGWTEAVSDTTGGNPGDVFANGMGQVLLASDGLNVDGNDFDTRSITRTIDATAFRDVFVELTALDDADNGLEGDDSLTLLIDVGDGMGFVEVDSVNGDFNGGGTSGTTFIGPTRLTQADGSIFQLRIEGVTNVEDYLLDQLIVSGRPAIPEPATVGLLGVGALALLRRRRTAVRV